MVKKLFLLSIVFLCLAGILSAENILVKRISVLKLLTAENKDEVSDALEDVLRDSLRISSRYLPDSQFVDVSQTFGSLDELASFTADNGLDYAIVCDVSPASAGAGYTVSVDLIDGFSGEILVSNVEKIQRSLEIFYVIDDVSESSLETIAGADLEFGTLSFLNTGNPELEYRVILNGRVGGDNMERIGRLPVGPYDITVEQISGSESFAVLNQLVLIQPNQEKTIEFSLEAVGTLQVQPENDSESFIVAVDGIRREGLEFTLASGTRQITVYQLFVDNDENHFEYPVLQQDLEILGGSVSTLDVPVLDLGPGLDFENKGGIGIYRVEVDGTVYEGSPYNIPVLPVGDHDIVITQIYTNGSEREVFSGSKKTRGRNPVEIRFKLRDSELAVEDMMVYVEGGTFSRHIQGEALAPWEVEELDVNVTVGSFLMLKYEVPNNLWMRVMGGFSINKWFPANGINWFDAVEFCNKLSEENGLEPCYTIDGTDVTCDFNKNGYRLPTEAEWEYAARGGKYKDRYVYSGSNFLGGVMNFSRSPSGFNSEITSLNRVDLYKPNSLGIYGMTGNAPEWCWDLYAPLPYYDTRNYQGPDSTEDEFRVFKGGIPFGTASDLTISFRGFLRPRLTLQSWGVATTSAEVHGFRIVRTVTE